MAFIPLEQLNRLYDGYQQNFRVGEFSLLLVQDEGRRFLLHNLCPHQQAPLDGATVRAGVIQCPVHGMQFDLLTGQGPAVCNGAKLGLISISFEGTQIGLDSSSLNTNTNPHNHSKQGHGPTLEW